MEGIIMNIKALGKIGNTNKCGFLLAIFLIFLETNGCNPLQKATPSPSEFKKIQIFNLSTAKKTKPNDVLDQMNFGGRGGGGFGEEVCDMNPPIFVLNPGIAFRYRDNDVLTCGWVNGEEVKITLTDPQKNKVVLNDKNSTNYRTFEFYPITEIPGNYNLLFEGKTKVVEYEFKLEDPGNQPGDYIDSEKGYLYIFNFSPNEHVRVIAYQFVNSGYEFVGWNDYKVSELGQLKVKIDSGLEYHVIGDKSGPIKDDFEIPNDISAPNE
jgi:hypothetical protein